MGPPGQQLGFYHAVLADRVADLRLAAGDPRLPVGVGVALYAETLRTLLDLGARKFLTKISAANAGVLNLYASIGFRFSHPEYVLHWHAPAARHLVSEGVDSRCYSAREDQSPERVTH
jgi:hypothetical protein